MAQPEYFFADLSINRQFLSQFTAQSLFDSLAIMHFAAGKFPLQTVGIGPMTLADQNLIAIPHNSGGH